MQKAFILAHVFACTLSAQAPSVTLPASAAQGMVGSALPGLQTSIIAPIPAVIGAPYSADAVTERVQQLADGNRIVNNSSSMVARDSQGRVRRGGGLAGGLVGLTNGNTDMPRIETIDDPVAGVRWTLDPQRKIARKLVFPQRTSQSLPTALSNTLPPPPGADRMWFVSSGGAGAQINVQAHAQSTPRPNDSVRTDLGMQTIEGIQAQGTRVTRTIPAGAVGNEQPLISVSESWISPTGLHALVET